MWKQRLTNWKSRIISQALAGARNVRALLASQRPRLQTLADRIQSQDRVRDLLEKARSLITRPQGSSSGAPRKWNWRHLLERTAEIVQKRGASFYGTAIAVAGSAYFISDVGALWIEGRLPEPSASSATLRGAFPGRASNEQDFASIWQRNLFSSKGLIPGESSPASDSVSDPGGAPQPSSLPFNLIGTLVLRNELRSIATIEDKGASLVIPVRIEDEIPSKARILSIEPSRVIFLNLGNGRREFIEIPEDATTRRVSIGGGTPTTAAVRIERAGNNFSVPRTDLDQAFTNLNSVLTQARAVPHYENGAPAGYKLFQVVPDGFFAKLGLKDQDIICGIDGQSVNDPAKALELLGQLKTANHVELCIKRDGRQQNFAYDIR